MNYDGFNKLRDTYRDTVKLWSTIAPYSGYKSQTISWRLIPAIENNRIRTYYEKDSNKCIGFVTWAWLTNEEFKTQVYDGPEVFKRDSGDQVHVVDFIAPYGNVMRIFRDIKRHLSDMYPDYNYCTARRGSREKHYRSANC